MYGVSEELGEWVQQESYKAVCQSLEQLNVEQLNVPYVLTYGTHENSDFGSCLFYEYFGPHFYAEVQVKYYVK